MSDESSQGPSHVRDAGLEAALARGGRHDVLHDVLQDVVHGEIVAPGVAPAASAAVALRRGDAWHVCSGAAGSVKPGRPCTPHTVFDLASVTKSVFACAVARWVRSGGAGWDTQLAALLPLARGTPSAHASLALLLSHRAGLEAHRELFAILKQRRALRRERVLKQVCRARRGDAQGAFPPAGFAPLYSDLGYILAGAALQEQVGVPLDTFIAREVSHPLGADIGSIRWWRSARTGCRAAFAPTEIVAWRGGVVHEVVHDENAWLLAGHGCSAHAGLFGTALGVARLGVALLEALRIGDALDHTAWLTSRDVAALVEPRPGGSLRMGFDGKSEQGSSAGRKASTQVFGHLGFTGTSIWCDPVQHTVVVLLTNRVHPTRNHIAIRSARPHAHDALLDAAETHVAESHNREASGREAGS